MESYSSKRISKDLLWYMAGSLVPIITLLFRSPIYTRVFSPEEYGKYTLVYLVFTYLSAVIFEWIRVVVWRYYLKYEKRGLLLRFWRSISLMIYTSIVIVIVSTLIWWWNTEDVVTQKLILFGAWHTITLELYICLLIVYRIKGKSSFYNIYNSFRIGISFIFLLWLTFIRDFGIEAFFLSSAIFNTIFLLPLIWKSSLQYIPSVKWVNVNDLKRFFNYGLSGGITTLITFFLVSGDRWVINHFWGLGKTGIYNQVFALAQMSIVNVITIVQASLNPYLFTNLEKKGAFMDHYLAAGFKWFVIIITPLVFYITLFSFSIGMILLGPDFRVAWHLIPIVAWAFYFDGAANFSSLKLRFSNRLKLIVGVVAAVTVINFSLNILLVPLVGYNIAALTTLISYIIMFMWYYFSARSNFITNGGNGKLILKITAVLLSQLIIHLLLDLFIYESIEIWQAIVEGLIFASLYFIVFKKTFKNMINGLENYKK